jgi:hypothetical protein
MSDFNPLDRAKVAVHRSSFDLSSKKLFTAKIGAISAALGYILNAIGL